MLDRIGANLGLQKTMSIPRITLIVVGACSPDSSLRRPPPDDDARSILLEPGDRIVTHLALPKIDCRQMFVAKQAGNPLVADGRFAQVHLAKFAQAIEVSEAGVG
jgi:hypothetical protein